MKSSSWVPLLALASVTSAASPFAMRYVAVARRWARDAASTPATAATTAMSLLPAPSGPYWANASLLGAEVSCDAASKRCLAIGRLPHAPSGRCYPVGDRRPCGDRRHIWALDAHALREGRVRGTCRQDDTCSFAMAFDGVCYDTTHIYSRLCDSRARIARHPTGRWECRCAGEGCPRAETEVRQPAAEGQCVLPDLGRRDLPSFRVPCTPAEALCLNASTLPFGGRCEQPLNSSVCPEGQWLALDERAAESGRLRAGCASERPCGDGALLLQDGGRCHWEEELLSTLCPNETILHLPTGKAVCTADVDAFVLISTENAGVCDVTFLELKFGEVVTEIRTVQLRCSGNNDGECPPEVAVVEPSPVVVSED